MVVGLQQLCRLSRFLMERGEKHHEHFQRFHDVGLRHPAMRVAGHRCGFAAIQRQFEWQLIAKCAGEGLPSIAVAANCFVSLCNFESATHRHFTAPP
jgi:hypothetical protein